MKGCSISVPAVGTHVVATPVTLSSRGPSPPPGCRPLTPLGTVPPVIAGAPTQLSKRGSFGRPRGSSVGTTPGAHPQVLPQEPSGPIHVGEGPCIVAQPGNAPAAQQVSLQQCTAPAIDAPGGPPKSTTPGFPHPPPPMAVVPRSPRASLKPASVSTASAAAAVAAAAAHAASAGGSTQATAADDVSLAFSNSGAAHMSPADGTTSPVPPFSPGLALSGAHSPVSSPRHPPPFATIHPPPAAALSPLSPRTSLGPGAPSQQRNPGGQAPQQGAPVLVASATAPTASIGRQVAPTNASAAAAAAAAAIAASGAAPQGAGSVHSNVPQTGTSVHTAAGATTVSAPSSAMTAPRAAGATTPAMMHGQSPPQAVVRPVTPTPTPTPRSRTPGQQMVVGVQTVSRMATAPPAPAAVYSAPPSSRMSATRRQVSAQGPAHFVGSAPPGIVAAQAATSPAAWAQR